MGEAETFSSEEKGEKGKKESSCRHRRESILLLSEEKKRGRGKAAVPSSRRRSDPLRPHHLGKRGEALLSARLSKTDAMRRGSPPFSLFRRGGRGEKGGRRKIPRDRGAGREGLLS